MLRRISQCYFEVQRYSDVFYVKRTFSERRRRKGDGTKTDIFEERSAASQEEYFRKETARQLKKIREEQKREQEEREGKMEKMQPERDDKDK